MDSMDLGLEDLGDEVLNKAIAADFAEISRLNNELVGLESYREIITKNGMSRDVGFGLEHVAPGVLGKLNLNMLTEVPTSTKMNVALEAIDWKSKVTKIAIVILVVGVILKIIDWMLGTKTPSLGSSPSGKDIAKNVEEQREKLHESITAAAEQIRAKPVQSVLAVMASKDEKWMQPIYKILIEEVDKRRMTEAEAVKSLGLMRMYRDTDYIGVKDKEGSLAFMFALLIKYGFVISAGTFAYYIGHGKAKDAPMELGIPQAFSSDISSYTMQRSRIGFGLLTVRRILEQGIAAGDVVAKEYHAAGGRGKADFGKYVDEIAREVTIYNNDIVSAFDNILGSGEHYTPIYLDVETMPAAWANGHLLIDRWHAWRARQDHAADDKYYGQPAGSRNYHHAHFTIAHHNRQSVNYLPRGMGASDLWWDEDYDATNERIYIDLRGKPGRESEFRVVDKLAIERVSWVLRFFDEPATLVDFIETSRVRQAALADEFNGSGDKETKRLQTECKELLSKLRVVEKQYKENIPTIWHVPWNGNVGIHFTDIDPMTGKDGAVIESNFGEVCLHLVKSAEALVRASTKCRVAFLKTSVSFRQFQAAMLGIDLRNV